MEAAPLTCMHRDCTTTATVKTRFGNGLINHGSKHGQRQTFVHYCDPHFQAVAALFVLCDISLLARKDGPFGPLPDRIRARTMTRVARTSP